MDVDQEGPTERPDGSGEGPQEGQPRKPLLEAMVRLWAEQGRTAEVDVVGVSMSPTLDGTQRVRARMGTPRVRFGDIVLFLWDGRLVVHRAVGRTSRGYRTRGDATKGFDPNPLPDDDLLGVVTHLLWSDRAVDLEGAVAGLLRWVLGVVSLLAGWTRLSPGGPLPGTRFLPRIRDILVAPLYHLFLRGSFRAYVLFSRLAGRRR